MTNSKKRLLKNQKSTKIMALAMIMMLVVTLLPANAYAASNKLTKANLVNANCTTIKINTKVIGGCNNNTTTPIILRFRGACEYNYYNQFYHAVYPNKENQTLRLANGIYKVNVVSGITNKGETLVRTKATKKHQRYVRFGPANKWYKANSQLNIELYKVKNPTDGNVKAVINGTKKAIVKGDPTLRTKKAGIIANRLNLNVNKCRNASKSTKASAKTLANTAKNIKLSPVPVAPTKRYKFSKSWETEAMTNMGYPGLVRNNNLASDVYPYMDVYYAYTNPQEWERRGGRNDLFGWSTPLSFPQVATDHYVYKGSDEKLKGKYIFVNTPLDIENDKEYTEMVEKCMDFHLRRCEYFKTHKEKLFQKTVDDDMRKNLELSDSAKLNPYHPNLVSGPCETEKDKNDYYEMMTKSHRKWETNTYARDKYGNDVKPSTNRIYLGEEVNQADFMSHYVNINGEWRNAKGKGLFKDPIACLYTVERCAPESIYDLQHGYNTVELSDGREMSNLQYCKLTATAQYHYHDGKTAYNGYVKFVKDRMWPELRKPPYK